MTWKNRNAVVCQLNWVKHLMADYYYFFRLALYRFFRNSAYIYIAVVLIIMIILMELTLHNATPVSNRSMKFSVLISNAGYKVFSHSAKSSRIAYKYSSLDLNGRYERASNRTVFAIFYLFCVHYLLASRSIDYIGASQTSNLCIFSAFHASSCRRQSVVTERPYIIFTFASLCLGQRNIVFACIFLCRRRACETGTMCATVKHNRE